MISRQTLIEIAKAKLTDSRILFKENKYDSSLYLIGYSVEMALKSKICKILNLKNGFPENKYEFQSYIESNENELGNEIKNLKQIKNHNLSDLLYYSGQEVIVKEQLLEEWTKILFWSPDLRYKLNFKDKFFNEEILISVEKLITLILK
jgi:hypothetical protein